MQLLNTTDFSDKFLRRMISWVCRQVGLPVRKIWRAKFTNCGHSFSGRAWPWQRSRMFLVRIGPDETFPTTPRAYGRGMIGACRDRIEGLVSITAHEVYHLVQGEEGHTREGLERRAVRMQNVTLEKFREDRAALLASWGIAEPTVEPVAEPVPVVEDLPEPIVEKPAGKSRQEKNADRALAALERWESKLRRARNAVRKYRAKVRRYERLNVIAASTPPKGKK